MVADVAATVVVIAADAKAVATTITTKVDATTMNMATTKVAVADTATNIYLN